MSAFLEFSKMHGLGNDFMVIDAVNQQHDWAEILTPAQIQHWSDRHFGIGFDQLLLVQPPPTPDFDFRYRIFNADGSEVQQCGNGARCFARFVRETGLTNNTRIKVDTLGGPLTLHVTADEQVQVDMGEPRFEPQALPFDSRLAEHLSDNRYRIEASGQHYELALVSMGNPHAVVWVSGLKDYPVAQAGPAIQAHPAFTEGVNVGFAEKSQAQKLALRVYERGSGETLACGTGACAAAVCAQIQSQVANPTEVALRGGLLQVDWAGFGEPVLMTGPAVFVFNGRVTPRACRTGANEAWQ